MSHRITPSAFVVCAALVIACGPTTSSVREEELLSAGSWDTTLSEGRLRQQVEAHVPSSVDPASCRLRVVWRSSSADGAVGPLEPTSVSGHQVWWRVVIDVGDTDVARAESHVACGDQQTSALPHHAATEASRARYCALCPGRERRAPTPPREWSRPGLRLMERVGVAARIDGSTVVDECTGRVLLDLRDVPGVPVRGATDPESEAELLLRADRGDAVCEERVLGSHLMIEGAASDLAQVTERLANVPELDVELSLDPYPG